MRRARRPGRLQLELLLSAVSLALLLLTVFWRDWIEAFIRVDPDAGSGTAEVAIAAAFAVATLLFSWRTHLTLRGRRAETSTSQA